MLEEYVRFAGKFFLFRSRGRWACGNKLLMVKYQKNGYSASLETADCIINGIGYYKTPKEALSSLERTGSIKWS